MKTKKTNQTQAWPSWSSVTQTLSNLSSLSTLKETHWISTPTFPMPTAMVLCTHPAVCTPLDHSNFPVVSSSSVSYGSCVPIPNYKPLLYIWLALSKRSIFLFSLTWPWGCPGEELYLLHPLISFLPCLPPLSQVPTPTLHPEQGSNEFLTQMYFYLVVCQKTQNTAALLIWFLKMPKH